MSERRPGEERGAISPNEGAADEKGPEAGLKAHMAHVEWALERGPEEAGEVAVKACISSLSQ